MKYCVKFDSVEDASNYYINNVPFACSINAPRKQDIQNLHTNKKDKKIKVIDNVAYIVNIEPLYFKSNGPTTISLSNFGDNAPDIKYSLDGGDTWTWWDYSSISLNDGQEIYFKGNNPNGFSTSYSKYSQFVFGGNGTIEAYGNTMSLIDDGACNTLTIPCGYCYNKMFDGCTSLISAPELPATTLAEWCYAYMFQNCTSLTSAPKFPQAILAESCYDSMFYGCTSLTSAPELPTIMLATQCYRNIFKNCTSLVNAPKLLSDKLAPYCYCRMFENCISLTSAPELPATVLADGCYAIMFQDCTSLTSAPDLPAVIIKYQSYEYMFYGCTSLTSAPELPATALVKQGYYNMFYGCTNLSYIKCLATSGIDTNGSTNNWVYNVNSTGTFIKDSNTTWPTGNNGIPTGWTVQNA